MAEERNARDAAIEKAMAKERNARDAAVQEMSKMMEQTMAEEMNALDAAIEKALSKERAARNAVFATARRDRESQIEKLRGEIGETLDKIDAQTKQSQKDLDEKTNELSEAMQPLTVTLIPLHLRTLLDLGRQKVLDYAEVDNWMTLRNGRNNVELTNYIMGLLDTTTNAPSQEAIELLCLYNNIRTGSNHQAHNATEDEIRDAVMSEPIGLLDRDSLERLFSFTFGSSV
ncbi:hypothetical protein H0H92_003832 [Tricholoma furcatifolium]|nr:hypothetical protein H0H92_003832 [Tricholoma furcatifolium]